MDVVLVESPAKAKTINKYLGSDYQVMASFGHVRDLPAKDGSVRPEDDFAMSWQVDRESSKRLNELAEAVRKADRLILATDPDREGEAISWHVLEVLRKKGALKHADVKRVVFNEITKSAVQKAMQNPRDIDKELVEAYLARRALDYLVGFTLSPVLWRKLPGARSAGRVQSVALRLICDRELEIETFKSREYWTIAADMANGAGTGFESRLYALDGKKLDKFALATAEDAAKAKARIEAGNYSVTSIEARPTRRNPYPPFTTSTLQQEASRKLGFNASRTMQVAQKLYEGMDIGGETVGLITYMRTDGVQIANEALAGCRKVIAELYGERYLPEKPRIYKTKAKNAQEAHEAIRPTDLSRTPEDVARYLNDEQRKLYELIWKRTVASQMEAAVIERTTADILSADGKVHLRATGSVQKFDGFLALYQEGRDDEEEENSNALPPLAKGEALTLQKVREEQHFTEPPPRYTEATLVKKLEELGIGRPSTYASVLSVLRDRNYVHMERNRFVPEDKGRLVTAFLESFFSRYVEYDFTAALEEQLDQISAGNVNWKDVLRDFWTHFSAAVDETRELRVSDILEKLNEILGPHIFKAEKEGEDPRACPKCGDGRLSLKVGKFGAFIGCSNYPECRYTRQMQDMVENGGKAATLDEPKVLGIDPESGLEVSLRSGRFGPYVQLGEALDGEKPKRGSIPKDMDVDSIDLEQALALINLPREVGTHPETGKPIKAAIGRYGPYVTHDGIFANLANSEEVFTVGINRAVSLLAEAKSKKRPSKAEPLKVLGEHPESKAEIKLMNGRYGPYVTDGKINATIPKGKLVDEIDLDAAVELINAKAAKGGGKARRRGGGKSAAK
ncbi:MAG: type I DNA topoisomerase [Alphaproteobacteria bacterium]|nr:MAG: type I DNA topoisomerase [Alphaproteobacteria bacterium]